MKIALIQSRIYRDRPADNLELIRAALKGEAVQKAGLAVFPALALSGRLGPAARRRPAVKAQYDKIWEDFLEISRSRPDMILASTRLVFTDDAYSEAAPVETAFAVKGGQIIYETSAAEDAPEKKLVAEGLKIRFAPGPDPAPPEAARGVQILATFREQLFQGGSYRPQSPGPGSAWRLNVSAVGGDGPFIYEGATSVFDPAGELKGWAGGFENAVIIFDAESKSLPAIGLPAREPVAHLYRALRAGLADYVRSAGTSKVIVGLSGGLDSAVVAALAADALGPDKLLGVAMPSEYSSPESFLLAEKLAVNLGIRFMTIPIDSIRGAFAGAFLEAGPGEAREGHLADENIQARIRGTILMYIANREDRLLLATCNKSEAAMGYSTLYGDSCGAIAPIGDVYKSRVYELAEYMNQGKEIIPRATITRPPSAELKPGQKDEDSLPPYEVLDDILRRCLEGRQSGSLAAREGGHSPMTVAWVLSAHKKSAFKRAQTPFALIASPQPLGGLDW